ncbi:MAG: phage tail sheath subtilisin-like domain-containing protein [Chloroflexia bacterium]
MPEYLAPGVYVEEVSFRPKSIEGVSTSTAGFVGATRYGPPEGEPELLTSFADFQRIYGGIDRLQFDGLDETENYMAHAVRAFFDNGGKRLYVSRVYLPLDEDDEFSGRAFETIGSPVGIGLRARFPGRAGDMRITFVVRTSANVLSGTAPNQVVRGVRENDVVYIHTPSGASGTNIEDFFDVVGEGSGMTFTTGTTTHNLSDLIPDTHSVHLVSLTVRVLKPGRFEDEMVWEGLSPHPQNRNAVQTLFAEDPNTRNRYLTIPFAIESSIDSGAEFAAALLGNAVQDALQLSVMSDAELAAFGSPLGSVERPRPAALEISYTLQGGNDGGLPNQGSYRGQEATRDVVSGLFIEASGLNAFESVDDISMVSAPGYSFRYAADANDNNRYWSSIVQALLTHCENMRYRVAILDSPNDFVLSEIRNFRGQFDSKYAALYYPWVTAIDPLDPDGRRELQLPPSGYVAGICARTDVQHGVFKAPANEVVLGAINFEKLLNKAQQDVLNPEGINCFRFFEGRGFRLWGARTISSDPEWKYFSVRRYFAYLEHSIDRGTQWAVFENNNDALWANVRRTVEDFLFNEWSNGALLGTKPEQAFFVRCDRSTMTQNDLDNGRLVCLIGVAVVKPAEYVIFRIGQWTADARS